MKSGKALRLLQNTLLSIIIVLTLLDDVSASGSGLDRYLSDPLIKKDQDMFDRDYYSKDPEIRGLLKQVEGYHLMQGIGKVAERRFESAFEEFDFILRYYPNHPRVLGLMGDLCVTMNRKSAGEEYFKKALALFPDMPRAGKALTYKEYGKYLFRFNDTDRAFDMLKQSATFDNSPSETQYYLGLVYFARKDYARANEHAQNAYGRGFTLAELREKLISVNAWAPRSASGSASKH